MGAGLALGLLACNTEDVEMRLLVYDKQEDAYVIDVVTVETLYDIEKLAGESTVVKGGLSIVLNYQEGGLEWRKEGDSVAFSAIRDGGVLVPDSFDSLAMASVYYNMELSYLFFKESLGLGDQMPPRLPTYYWPTVETIQSDGQRYIEMDNAFYMKIDNTERGFFVVPFDEFQWIPMALNSGIMTHEFTHYIFDIFVNDNVSALDNESENFLRSANEGTADFLAVVRTEDPDYMSHSIPAGLYVTPDCNSSASMELTRDIANPDVRNYTGVMDYVARATSPADYCPYEIGLVVAAMLYEIAGHIDGLQTSQAPSRKTMLRVGKWWLNALEKLGDDIGRTTTFELWDLFSLFIAEMSNNADKNTACDVFDERYSVYVSEVEGC